MTQRLLIAVAMLLALAHPLQAYSLRLCLSCRNACDRRAESDDAACCRQAQGTQTNDFCFSKLAADYIACSKPLREVRSACKIACEKSDCAR